MNQHFPNDQCIMLQNHTCEKDPFIVQDKPKDINGTE